MIVVINHRDSFVFNLVRYIRELNWAVRVVDFDQISIDALNALMPSAVILSPGPCTPSDAPASRAIVKHFSGQIPILGVCLGHQIIGDVFGAAIGRANTPLYGQASPIRHTGEDLFHGLDNPLNMGLYHSLIVNVMDEAELRVQAWSPSDEVMAMRHADHPTFGVQFHPESILSQQGHALLSNFLAKIPSAI